MEKEREMEKETKKMREERAMKQRGKYRIQDRQVDKEKGKKIQWIDQ